MKRLMFVSLILGAAQLWLWQPFLPTQDKDPKGSGTTQKSFGDSSGRGEKGGEKGDSPFRDKSPSGGKSPFGDKTPFGNPGDGGGKPAPKGNLPGGPKFWNGPEASELRGRPISPYEKQSAQNLAPFASLVEPFADRVVKLVDSEGRQVAFGTVVREDGMVVTKASEIASAEGLTAVSTHGQGGVRLLSINERFDIALIHVDIDGLQPVTWSGSEATIGTLIVSPDDQGHPIAIGVVSVQSRPLMDRGRAFLGVEPITVDDGILVRSVTEDSAADKAGLQAGDIIIEMDEAKVSSSHDFANSIRLKHPGDHVAIVFLRDGLETAVDVVLDEVNLPSEFQMQQDEMGAEMSQRMSDFDLAFQHDMPLWPEQCGSPLVDLDGNVVGLNIARSGRVRSYAIPAQKMPEIVDGLIESIQLML